MARYPHAVWKKITGSSGSYTGGPFKIVHHTTEGFKAQDAMAAFLKHGSDPHFTVDADTVYQHIDTDVAARALRNLDGGVQTNRDSAIQIELVGFAHQAKNHKALANLARLCRWLEQTHGIPRVWPAGPPRPAKNGKDPGGHKRDATIWDTQGGHYGHSHVPENTHWDPAYSAAESKFVLEAEFDAQGALIAGMLPASAAAAGPGGAKPESVPKMTVSTMPDHAEMPSGLQAYIRDLPVLPYTAPHEAPTAKPAGATRKAAKALKPKNQPAMLESVETVPGQAQVNVGSVLSFAGDIAPQLRDDVLYSIQLAQRAASGAYDRFTKTRAWYQSYVEVLENLGWATEQFAFTRFEQSEGEFRMDKAALAIITAIATQNQLAILQQSIDALGKLADNDGAISMFDFHSSAQGSGNFQLGSVQQSSNGAVSMALGAFYFRSVDERRRLLFVKWGSREVNFWTAAQRMTLNTDFYARRRADVIRKLHADSDNFLSTIKLGGK